MTERTVRTTTTTCDRCGNSVRHLEGDATLLREWLKMRTSGLGPDAWTFKLLGKYTIDLCPGCVAGLKHWFQSSPALASPALAPSVNVTALATRRGGDKD